MEITTNTLQKLIEKRASDRLSAEISTLFNPFSNSPLINNNESDQIRIQVPRKKGDETIWENKSLRSALIYSGLQKAIHEQWLPEYTERETKLFVQQVDSLQEQINDLKLNQDL